MKPKKIGSFIVDVYDFQITLFVGLPEDMKPNTAAYAEWYTNTKTVNIYLKEDYWIGNLMHECIHAADFILNGIGADMGTNPNDSEVRAYLATYIFGKCGCLLGTTKEKKKGKK